MRMGRTKREIEEEEDDDMDEDEEQEQSGKKRRSSTPSNKRGKRDSEEVNIPAPSLETKSTSFVYGDLHRAVLQYFLSRKYVTEAELERDSTALGRNPAKQTLQQLLKEVNEKLFNEEVHMQIRQREMLEEEGQERVWGLVNTKSDDIAKQATTLETWQLALFNSCLALLAKSGDGSFSHTEAIDAYHAVPDAVHKPGNDILSTLKKLVGLGWLRETNKAHFYSAGPRTMLELSDVLRELGAIECPISKQIVINTRAYKNWLKEKAGGD